MKRLKYKRVNIIKKVDDVELEDTVINIQEGDIVRLPIGLKEFGDTRHYLSPITNMNEDFSGNGVYLSESYDWLVVKDSHGSRVLIAVKKGVL